MRAVILAFVIAAALSTVSAQAALPPPKPSAIELGTAPFLELVSDGCGRGWHRTRWRDQWAIGMGVTVFRTEVLTAATARGGTIRRPFGAALLHHGVGVRVIHTKLHAPGAFGRRRSRARSPLRQANTTTPPCRRH
jgi:hypothetical protein